MTPEIVILIDKSHEEGLIGDELYTRFHDAVHELWGEKEQAVREVESHCSGYKRERDDWRQKYSQHERLLFSLRNSLRSSQADGESELEYNNRILSELETKLFPLKE